MSRWGRVRWLVLGAMLSCKGAGSAGAEVSAADAGAAIVEDSAAAPVTVLTPRFDAGEPIALYEDDRVLWVSYSGGMQRPCGKTKLAPPPTGRYVVDLAKETVTVEISSRCSGAVTRHGTLSKPARAKLKELIAAMGAPSGKPGGADGPGYTVTILRADAHVAMQGGRGFGDYSHDGNAADIAEYLDGFLVP